MKNKITHINIDVASNDVSFRLEDSKEDWSANEFGDSETGDYLRALEQELGIIVEAVQRANAN